MVRCDDHDGGVHQWELVQRGIEPAVRPRAIVSDRTAGQFPIWDRIGRVDGCVSVTFRIVDVDRAGIVWGSVEWKKTGLHILRN